MKAGDASILIQNPLFEMTTDVNWQTRTASVEMDIRTTQFEVSGRYNVVNLSMTLAEAIAKRDQLDRTIRIAEKILKGEVKGPFTVMEKKREGSSRYTGVINVGGGRWRADITILGKAKFRYFKNERDAAQQYNDWIIEAGIKRPLNQIEPEE